MNIEHSTSNVQSSYFKTDGQIMVSLIIWAVIDIPLGITAVILGGMWIAARF